MQKLCGWELSLHPWDSPAGFGQRHEDIAADLGIAVRSVGRAMEALEEARYLHMIRRGQKGQTQVYQLILPDQFSRTVLSG